MGLQLVLPASNVGRKAACFSGDFWVEMTAFCKLLTTRFVELLIHDYGECMGRSERKVELHSITSFLLLFTSAFAHVNDSESSELFIISHALFECSLL